MNRRIELRHLALTALIALSMTVAACGGADTRESKEERARVGQVESPELEVADQKLERIEADAQALRSNIDTLQSQVASHVGTDASKLQVELDGGPAFVEIDRNSIIRVNGIAMSQTDFGTYTQRRGKTLCNPDPKLVVHPAADYDVVAASLDLIYAEGCANVDITETENL